MITTGPDREAVDELRHALARQPPEIPSKYFYDEYGSKLFERITELPEYYLTRTERALLEGPVHAWVRELRPCSLVELGAGSAAKTRLVLDAMRAGGEARLYVPVDVSARFMEQATARLGEEYPELQIQPLVADFTRGETLPEPAPPRAIYAILGSTIGNFEDAPAARILRGIAATMSAEDRLLLGADLDKDPAIIEAAYNDAEGVTAEFNRNILRVVNRRFGTALDPAAFTHGARYNRSEGRVEMYLIARQPQRLELPGAGTVTLEAGELIRTEISCKYTRERLESVLAAAGLRLEAWTTDSNAWYAMLLARPLQSLASLSGGV
ncbi:MAG: L-histidine N(alpha)-methyltransferase [Longimicrobiales bacterium]